MGAETQTLILDEREEEKDLRVYPYSKLNFNGQKVAAKAN